MRNVPDDPQLISRILARAFPGHGLLAFEPLTGGLSNPVYLVHTPAFPEPLVLRLYSRDPAACRKEIELHRLVGAAVPVAGILHADCDGDPETPPHVLMRRVEGLTFREIKRRRDPGEIAGCARAIGAVLARIGAFTFERPGGIGPDLAIGEPLIESIPAFVEQCLAAPDFVRRMELRDRLCLREFIRRWEPDFAALDRECSLVHADFGGPNLLLRQIAGRWEVAAVLDWEFAFSGPALCDVGHMLRYERLASPRIEPHFSAAFRDHGGALPLNWRDLSRALDLTALCEFLARPALPDSVLPEILELALATIQHRDPRIA
jgi:aminoglycoside phosphotransferase (APT) family kinase protein